MKPRIATNMEGCKASPITETDVMRGGKGAGKDSCAIFPNISTPLRERDVFEKEEGWCH